MKLTPIVAAVALALPMTANAQSVADTHELRWYPAGKTPSSTYRPRDKPICVKRADTSNDDREQRRIATRCAADAKTTRKPVSAR